MKKTIGKFSIDYMQILDENGKANKEPDLSREEIKKLYEYMVLSRVFDEKALALQRQGRLGTYASVLGQEASQVGSAYAASKEDWIFTTFRESSVYIVKGMDMKLILQYWGGDERGDRIPDTLHLMTVAVPISTQIPHAVGAAWGMKMKKKKTASLVYFGDGATSRGDFHEGMNFAGVFNLPCVFLCQNNQYAISVPFTKQTGAETIAQKSIAYGIEGIRVNGNDIFAIYEATRYALEKAKSGKGPTLIEAFTYRRGDHTTSDDASRYRDEKEVKKWEKRDPILRLEKFMKANGMWTKEYANSVKQKAKQQVEKAVEEYEAIEAPDPADIFRYTFEKMPSQLQEQWKELEESIKESRKEK